MILTKYPPNEFWVKIGWNSDCMGTARKALDDSWEFWALLGRPDEWDEWLTLAVRGEWAWLDRVVRGGAEK